MILVVGLLVAGGCIRLGIWQLERLDARDQRNRHAEAQLALPPVQLDGTLARAIAAEPDRFRFRTVVASGRFDFERELVVMARARQGVPGVHLVTPLVIDDSLAVLVERGWLPSPDGRTIRAAVTSEATEATVEGVLLRADGRVVPSQDGDAWPRPVIAPDPALVGAWYPYRLVPLLLRRRRAPSGSELRSVDLPELSSGPHLSYAVQWFAFATIALVGSIVLFLRRGGEPPRGQQPPVPP
jgi:surfeit locus 1 family protein